MALTLIARGDPAPEMTDAANLGGDCDTPAIAGGLARALVGAKVFPVEQMDERQRGAETILSPT